MLFCIHYLMQTIVGDGNMLMGSCHVAHDVCLGDNNIIGNNSVVIPSRMIVHTAMIPAAPEDYFIADLGWDSATSVACGSLTSMMYGILLPRLTVCRPRVNWRPCEGRWSLRGAAKVIQIIYSGSMSHQC